MKNPTRTGSKGFTLVELLVVLVIVAVLATISVTAIFKFRNNADKTVAMNGMRQLQLANVGYASDNNGQYVPANDGAYGWFENPELLESLTSESQQTIEGNASYKVSKSFLDPLVYKRRSTNYEKLHGSYSYNVTDAPEDGFRNSQVVDPARSMAFATATPNAAGTIDAASASRIDYRHNEKGLVVFYDGHAEEKTKGEISKIKGGASGAFWDANQADN